MEDEYLILRRNVLRAKQEIIEAMQEEFDKLRAELATVNKSVNSLQEAQTSKKELIIIFLRANEEYLDTDKYSSRVLASILSEAINQDVSHVYANTVRKGMQ